MECRAVSSMAEKMIDFARIEKKWQKKWEEERIFQVSEKSKKKKYYVLDMFPYPSGRGLHIGHAFVFSLGDIYARFKRMQGFNVLYPIGYDSLGLPAENAAIKAGTHPKDYTKKSMANFMKQQKAMGWSYDWSRMVMSHSPDFYRWDQWIFLKMLEKGVAYRKKAPVNWCRKCNSVLANEQVMGGKCWRHEDTDVEIKHLEQWFLKISDYSERLLKGLEEVDWPERAKRMQRNWIGKSYGYDIDFDIPDNANYVLLHGFTGSPNANFFPWLKKKLEEKGHKVNVPKLPNTNNPNINEQIKHVLQNCKFDENTVLLGHSLGGPVALKVIENLKKPIKKLILAAGFVEPNTKDRCYVKTFDWKFDFDKIKKNVNEILILRDENDKDIRKDAANKIKTAVGGKIINFVAEDEHICGKKEPIVLDNCLNKWKIFTTRPDTLFGVAFMVVSAQHSRLNELVTSEQRKEVDKFLKQIRSTSEKDIAELEKEGAFTGSYAVNPANGSKIPVYVGNFVVADYGCGMVMAVPAHDQRDFEFAKKYKIKIKQVIEGEITDTRAFTGEGKIINSGKFDGLSSRDAIDKIGGGFGKKTINYKLRDWLISRQRYWGTPIPIIYCDKCGAVPVPEKDLPVKLPEKIKFGKGNPLLTNKDFINVKCPKCSGKARRETDTMDTFANSSWYYLRYTDPKNSKEIFEKKKANYWCPIDQYIGGPEHITMHLIYIRFYTKFLQDLGLLKFDEPALKYFTQGVVKGADGERMSKSKGNVVEPFDMIKKYGADSLRLYLVSNSSPESDFDWDDKGVYGSFKFVNKIYDYFSGLKFGKVSARVEHKLNKGVKEITSDVEEFKHNLAVIKIKSLFDSFVDGEIDKKSAESFLKILHVYCPFVTEELWAKIGGNGFVSLASWPVVDEGKIDENLEKAERAVEKTVGDILNILKIVSGRVGKGGGAGKVYVYVLPPEKEFYSEEELSTRIGREVKVFAVNDAKKYDPKSFSKKAKIGRPAIFVE